MCDKASVLLVYLPPYLLDFNLIETLFLILKAWIKQHSSLILFYTETKDRFRKFLEHALEAVMLDILFDADVLFQVASIEYP